MDGVNEFIDEIADAPASAIDALFTRMPDAFFQDVCAVVEYELFRRHTRPDLPALGRYSTLPILSKILQLLDNPTTPKNQLSLQAVASDAIAIPVQLSAERNWVTFKKRAEASAMFAGFSELVAAGIAGAIHEMADNIVQHSQAETSGVAAFRSYDRSFEYVVGDAGVGILASLHRSDEFSRLRDDIEALSLAVLPGVSRFGRVSGRGYGFRAVFSPLKGAPGAVRLRSGYAVLSMAGTGLSPDRARCSQRSRHQGVVVSVRVTSTN